MFWLKMVFFLAPSIALLLRYIRLARPVSVVCKLIYCGWTVRFCKTSKNLQPTTLKAGGEIYLFDENMQRDYCINFFKR